MRHKNKISFTHPRTLQKSLLTASRDPPGASPDLSSGFLTSWTCLKTRTCRCVWSHVTDVAGCSSSHQVVTSNKQNTSPLTIVWRWWWWWWWWRWWFEIQCCRLPSNKLYVRCKHLSSAKIYTTNFRVSRFGKKCRYISNTKLNVDSNRVILFGFRTMIFRQNKASAVSWTRIWRSFINLLWTSTWSYAERAW